MIENPSGGESSYAVVIDESITDEISDLVQLQNRVKVILGHKNLTLLRWENLNLESKSNPSEKNSRQEIIAVAAASSNVCSPKASIPPLPSQVVITASAVSNINWTEGIKGRNS